MAITRERDISWQQKGELNRMRGVADEASRLPDAVEMLHAVASEIGLTSTGESHALLMCIDFHLW
jgi:hypothetical protein